MYYVSFKAYDHFHLYKLTYIMLIPYQEINEATLVALIETYIDREGTDYGESEVSRSNMINQVHQQLTIGKVVICYDPDSQTCNILTASQAKMLEKIIE